MLLNHIPVTSVWFHIKRPGKTNVQFKVFGSSIWHNEDAADQRVSFVMQHMMKSLGQSYLTRTICHHVTLMEAAQGDNLLGKKLRLLPPNEVIPATGRSCPSFTGITDIKLREILNKYDDEKARASMNADEEIIALLSQTSFIGRLL
tara:strand:- start:2313 stop:2753 length:441 start_codon:yes stop_codon:yes gene_type:complete